MPDSSVRLSQESDHLAWRVAVDAAGVGAFEWNLVTGDLRWDDRLLELFGLDEATFGGTIEAFNDRVHPEDLRRVTDALTSAIETVGEYVAEYRIMLPAGGLRWISARGRAVADEAGGPAAMLVGAAFDTTAVQDGEAKISRVLEAMPTAFVQVDRDWRFSFINSEAERLLGTGRGDLLGGSIWELFQALAGSDFERECRHAAQTGEPVSFDAYYPPPLDTWYEVRAWPSPDGLAVYFVDVTARHQAKAHLDQSERSRELRAAVSEALTGTLDASEDVSSLANLLVPSLADWCVVTLVEDPDAGDWRDGLRDVGWAHADPASRDLVRRYAELRISALADDSFLARVLFSGTEVVVGQDAAASIAAVLTPGEARDHLLALDPATAMGVPLRARNKTVGVISAFRGRHREPFSGTDRDLLLDLAARAALAIDNARLYAEQHDLAAALQRSLLTEPPQSDALEVAVRYLPAAQAAQVGGDWYDAFRQLTPDSCTTDTVVVIGDVVGHDVEAAAAMGQIRGLLRGIAAHSGAAPVQIVRGVDTVMETLSLETTATVVVARIEADAAGVPGALVRWSNAGHPPPLLLDRDGRVQVLDGSDGPDEPDLLLGLNPNAHRTEHRAALEPGATLVLYTDGLVERRDQSIDNGIAELARNLTELSTGAGTLDGLCDALLDRMVPAHPEDDVALLMARID